MSYYKLLNDDLVHYGFKYVEGLNVDTFKFNPNDSCKPGGLYYTDFEHIGSWASEGRTKIAQVTLPPDAHVYNEPCKTKWKADRLVLGPIRPLKDFLAEQTDDTIMRWLDQGYACQILAYFAPTSPVVCQWMVKKWQDALNYIPVHTAELSLVAVEAHPEALRCVKPEFLTQELALVACRGNPALADVYKDEAFRLAVVAENPEAINYMSDPSRTVIAAAMAAAPPTAKFEVKILRGC